MQKTDLSYLREVADAVYSSGAHNHAGAIEEAIKEIQFLRKSACGNVEPGTPSGCRYVECQALGKSSCEDCR